MKVFEKNIKVGTKVMIEGNTEFDVVESFENNRKLIRVVGKSGSLQRAHIVRFTNRGVKK